MNNEEKIKLLVDFVRAIRDSHYKGFLEEIDFSEFVRSGQIISVGEFVFEEVIEKLKKS